MYGNCFGLLKRSGWLGRFGEERIGGLGVVWVMWRGGGRWRRKRSKEVEDGVLRG